jgi:hypothetical protein
MLSEETDPATRAAKINDALRFAHGHAWLAMKNLAEVVRLSSEEELVTGFPPDVDVVGALMAARSICFHLAAFSSDESLRRYAVEDIARKFRIPTDRLSSDSGDPPVSETE